MKKLLLLTFVLINFSIYAQIQIKGIVIDGLTDETLIGANIIVKETNNGTATSFNGDYVIIYKGKFPATLSVSYLGYKNLEIEINSKNPTPIKLFTDSENLKEVKVVDSRITQKQKGYNSIIVREYHSIPESISSKLSFWYPLTLI